MPMVIRPFWAAPGTGVGPEAGAPPDPPQAVSAVRASPARAAAATRREGVRTSVPPVPVVARTSVELDVGQPVVFRVLLGDVEVVRGDVGAVTRAVVGPHRLDFVAGVLDDRGPHRPPADGQDHG